MTNPTPPGQVPEALRLAEILEEHYLRIVRHDATNAATELRRLHAENEALRTAHVQNPAEIEHVAGDVSKNGAEVNMTGGALLACPCGAIPTALQITGDEQAKWAHVSGNCCGEWEVEYRNNYAKIASPEAMALAVKAWNEALRTQQPVDRIDLHQALTDPENQPNQYGVQFLMRGPKMAFKIGNRQFCLDYEPTEPGEFEFMRDALIDAFSIFTPDVKIALRTKQPAPAGAAPSPATIPRAYRGREQGAYESGWKEGYKHGAWAATPPTPQPAPATQQAEQPECYKWELYCKWGHGWGWGPCESEYDPRLPENKQYHTEDFNDPEQVRNFRALYRHAPQPSPAAQAAYTPPAHKWLKDRLAIADDSEVQAGVPPKKVRPCDTPPGCNSHNCLECNEFETATTAQAAESVPAVDEAFDCARAALNQCPDRASIAHILDVLRTRVLAARAPAESVGRDAPAATAGVTAEQASAMVAEMDMHDSVLVAIDAETAAPAAGAVAGVDRATVIEWLDANDIEVTDRQMDGLFHAAAPSPAAQQTDELPREDFAWRVVKAACETEPADEDDPECIRILRIDLKSAVLAALLQHDAALAQKEGKTP